MRLPKIVRYFGQVLAGYLQQVGQIVISGRDNNLAGAIVEDAVRAVRGSNVEVSILPSDRLDPLILVNVQLVMLGDAAVVLQRLLPRGLEMSCVEWDLADFQKFRRGEEHHVRRIVVNRVDHAALVDDQSLQANLLRFDGTSQPSGPSSDDQYVTASVRAGPDLGSRQ